MRVNSLPNPTVWTDELKSSPDLTLELIDRDGGLVRLWLWKDGTAAPAYKHLPAATVTVYKWIGYLRYAYQTQWQVQHLVPIIDAAFESLKEDTRA